MRFLTVIAIFLIFLVSIFFLNSLFKSSFKINVDNKGGILYKKYKKINNYGELDLFSVVDENFIENKFFNKKLEENYSAIAGVNSGSCFFKKIDNEIIFSNCSNGIFKRGMENSLNKLVNSNIINLINDGDLYYVEKN